MPNLAETLKNKANSKPIMGVTEAISLLARACRCVETSFVEFSTVRLENLISALRRLKNALIFNKV